MSPNDFLLNFHRDQPGLSSLWFQRFRSAEGLNSYQLLARSLAASFPSGALLDVACGDGSLLLEIGKVHQGQLCGIDQSPQELALAQKLLGPDVDLVCADAHDPPFEDRAFGAITCHMALMVMPRPMVVLQQMLRLLRPGGAVFLMLDGGRIQDQFTNLAVERILAHLDQQPQPATFHNHNSLISEINTFLASHSFPPAEYSYHSLHYSALPQVMLAWPQSWYPFAMLPQEVQITLRRTIGSDWNKLAPSRNIICTLSTCLIKIQSPSQGIMSPKTRI